MLKKRFPIIRTLLGVTLGLVQFILLGVALWDLRQRSGDRINGPKKLWSLVVFINYVGPIAYLVLGRK
jgi:hypothetical protein